MKPLQIISTAALILLLCNSCTFGPCGPVFFWDWKDKIPKGVTYSGGDGTSREKSVVIRGTQNRITLKEAETAWAWNHNLFYDQNNHPPTRQSETNGDKSYDVMTIHTHGGKVKTIYFDVSDAVSN